MKVLIVSVHPDDEVLGCGGTMMKLKAEGHDLYWLLMTDVTKAHGYNDEMVETTRRQIEELSQFVGFRDTFNCGYHAAHLHQVDFLDLVGDISKVMLSVKPDWVFSVNRSDIHTDHQVAARAVMSCSKSFRYPFIKRLSLYECISETEIAPPLPENVFLPNFYCDISSFISDKLDMMRIYNTEIQEVPQPRSLDNIKALARYRGASISVEYAEAYMQLRDII